MQKDRQVIMIDRGLHLKKLNAGLQMKRRQLERIAEMQREVLNEMAQAQREQERALRAFWKKTG